MDILDGSHEVLFLDLSCSNIFPEGVYCTFPAQSFDICARKHWGFLGKLFNGYVSG